jgi:hypothetical protein
MVSDWRNTFADGNIKVDDENCISFAFGIVQVTIF